MRHIKSKNAMPLARAGLLAALMLFVVPAAHAVLGSGWVQYNPDKRIHLDGEAGQPTTFTWSTYQSNCSPICADYSYANGIDTFRILDSRSNRSELRIYNDYSTGSRQFEGDVRFFAPLNDESLMQIFGSTSGATQMMIRGYSANGGSISAAGTTLATNAYGVWTRINVIHLQEDRGNRIQIYVNGAKRVDIADNEAVSNYHKYGNYGTMRTGEAIVEWRNVKHYRDGSAPGSSGVTFNGNYRIMARHSGSAVVVQGASTLDGANVIQWTYGGTATNDEWQVASIGSGFHTIRARHSGKAMTVQSASTADGGNVIQWTYGGATTNDEWSFVDAGGGYYRIVNRHSGKVLEVAGGNTANGANVQQWTWNGGAHQQFQIISVP